MNDNGLLSQGDGLYKHLLSSSGAANQVRNSSNDIDITALSLELSTTSNGDDTAKAFKSKGIISDPSFRLDDHVEYEDETEIIEIIPNDDQVRSHSSKDPPNPTQYVLSHLHRNKRNSPGSKSSLPPLHHNNLVMVSPRCTQLTSAKQRSSSCPSFTKDNTGLNLPLATTVNTILTPDESSNSSQQSVYRRPSSRTLRHVNSHDQLRQVNNQEYLRHVKSSDQLLRRGKSHDALRR